MSNLCKTQLCATVESSASEIASSDATTDFLFSTFAVDGIEPTNRISKVTFGSLPDANTVPNGQVAYLDDAKVPVIASNGTWIGFDGRVVGSFVENQIFAWGFNNCGQLGDGTAPASVPRGRCSPIREVCLATGWRQVSAGTQFSAAIKTSGELWAWGRNIGGPLGDGTTTTRCSPVREFCSATDWCQVSAGNLHTSAIKTSGELWAWGPGNCGNLGDGTLTDKCSPVREFCSATDWCQVSAGCESTSAIKTSGQLWVWGGNFCGIIGDGTTTQRCSPVREFCSATDWCQTSSGFRRSAAIKTSGELWVWGTSITGDGTTAGRCSPVREFCSATDWCQVSRPAGSASHTVAIKTSGQLWAWGFQSCGQLGDGTLTNRCSPVREMCSATDWCQVSAGTCHTTAIKTSGELWSWGFNNCGQLGDGTHGAGGCKCSPVREFSSSTNWRQVSGGHDHSVAIKSLVCVCR